jgi:outer membrane protein TolC
MIKMKRKILKIMLLLFLVTENSWSQKMITLKECYDKALAKTSLSAEKEAYNSIWQLKDKNLSKNWFPTLDAGANFVYNSDVVDMRGVFSAVPAPGFASAIKPLPHEQYKFVLDINQVIYDGGVVKKSRAVERADLSINQQQTETDLYKLRSQINSCFFSLILIDRQKELLNNYHDLIGKRIKSMQSAAANGVILQADIDIMTSEKIKLEQQINENEIKRKALLNVLSDLTGEPAEYNVSFILPQTRENPGYDISRPELKLFDMRKEQLNAGLGMAETKRMPKAFGFATLGYGNPPGSNFFKDEFAPYYIVGAGIKWNIFDWNRLKNEKQQIKIQQDILDNRKTDLTDNLKRSLEMKRAEISSLGSLIEKDAELILLRNRITATASSQYENGIITATDFLNELNAERQAKIDSEIHKINLALANIEYLNISGKDIE